MKKLNFKSKKKGNYEEGVMQLALLEAKEFPDVRHDITGLQWAMADLKGRIRELDDKVDKILSCLEAEQEVVADSEDSPEAKSRVKYGVVKIPKFF